MACRAGGGENAAVGLTVERCSEVPGWLKAAGSDLTDEVEFRRVGERLPAGYEVYLRLFHPFVPWGTYPESVVGDDERRTWRSLAAEAGAPYHPALRWNDLEPALPDRGDGRPFEVHEGQLEPVTRQRLFAHLQRVTAEQVAYFFYGTAAAIVLDGFVLVRASVGEVEDVVAWAWSHDYDILSTPTFVWPEDRAWIVCTDYDSTSTYIAVSRVLADVLLADPHLEIVEVDRTTRLDDEP